jgi:hypothetical protein
MVARSTIETNNLDVLNLDGLQFLTNLESFIANGELPVDPLFLQQIEEI